MEVYIVELNNGEYYEDYNKWNGGVFSDLSVAIQAALDSKPVTERGFCIQKWELDGKQLLEIEFEYRKGVWCRYTGDGYVPVEYHP